MDVRHLQIFASVFRNANLSAAARELGLDPSRVSRVIQILEAELGVPLFQRSTRQVVPTEAGRVYHAEVALVLEALDAARAKVSDVQRVPSGELRVSSPVSFGLLNVVPWLPEFLEQYPRISLDLRLHDAPPVLGPEGVDLAVAIGPLRDSGAVAVPLAQMRTHLCASPTYLQRHGRPTEPSAVAGHAALVLDLPGYDSVWRFRRTAREPWREVPVRGVFRSSNALALKACALAGRGLLLQAGWIVGRELREGTLVELFPGWTVRATTHSNPAMWLLHPAQPYLPQKVRVFTEFLRARFAHGCPWENERPGVDGAG